MLVGVEHSLLEVDVEEVEEVKGERESDSKWSDAEAARPSRRDATRKRTGRGNDECMI